MNMHANEESKIKWFVRGLKRDIRDFVELKEYSSLKSVFRKAIKVKGPFSIASQIPLSSDSKIFSFKPQNKGGLFIEAPSPKGNFSAIRKRFLRSNLNIFQEPSSRCQLLEYMALNKRG